MVSVILATISKNDEAERFIDNLRFHQTLQTSTNSPQSLLDKIELRFFRHRQEQGWTNKQSLNILVTLLKAFYIIYF